MDTSKEYIKMCKEAWEIQFKYRYAPGDFVSFGCAGIGFHAGQQAISVDNCLVTIPYFKGNIYMTTNIWLPRQDQLQEIWWDKLDDSEKEERSLHFAWIQDFYHDWASIDVRKTFRFMTMEQLYLAFVMKRCYNKVWDGKNWIKES